MSTESPVSQRGTVRWFRADLGYGFIDPAEGADAVFFHFSALQMDGYKFIDDGATVDYSSSVGPKGVSASIVVPVVVDGVAVD